MKKFLHLIAIPGAAYHNFSVLCQSDFLIVGGVGSGTGAEVMPNLVSDVNYVSAGGVAGLAYSGPFGPAGAAVICQFQAPVRAVLLATEYAMPPVVTIAGLDGTE